jgi:hypothetical protein
MLQEEQIERWKALRDEMFSNEEFLKQRLALDDPRKNAIQEMNECLKQYLAGEIDNNEFRSIFQLKTATDWSKFGLGGFSGAMFLNMLVNNTPNQNELAQQLKATLPVPMDANDGYHRLNNFMDYLKELLRSGIVTKQNLQPAHAPFFFSSWWHIQNIQEWPIYYTSARNALASEEVYMPLSSQPVDNFFTFREAFLGLSKLLELTTWEMEHLCVWREESSIHIAPPVEPIEAASSSFPVIETIAQTSTKPSEEEKVHSQIQWLLARIGQKFGYRVWIAANDRKRTWNGETLGKYSINDLPYLNGVSSKSQRMIELIDVVWLNNSRVVAAFEVESTTSIYSGLLRMSDLALALDGFILRLFIAVPSMRVEDVKAQLSRLTFQHLELHERCRFFTFEKLIEEAEPMMRYAKDVNAIDQISQQVGGINEEGF